MRVTNSFFYNPQVKNKPCIHWAYMFILEYSTIVNNKGGWNCYSSGFSNHSSFNQRFEFIETVMLEVSFIFTVLYSICPYMTLLVDDLSRKSSVWFEFSAQVVRSVFIIIKCLGSKISF
jgi:hypothetical protein